MLAFLAWRSMWMRLIALLELRAQELANAVILFHVVGDTCEFATLRRPLFLDAEANADRMNLLTHTLLVAYPKSDVTVALE